ncbi:interferon-inducible double-stranded RNA-dependent protein kinase activator A homolog isoform X3 [Hippoglossus stenolepis]|uniref:interferon-inducible double-stranded RNA-dependent protein kinase activator A homolog isoform X3 n=1 Tax=Hippoglossus stenolepis TaxID=195615 RepID=UPI001FAF3D31|nr:interferon-inducible double-stranded RNA-dependent protein kinase activator A homolog isoform X3 [Hippoglossus stenolepis]
MAQEGFPSAAVKTTADSGLSPVETQRNIPGKTPIQILHEYGTKTGSLPVYVMEKAEGEAHQPSFVSSVTIGDVSSTVQGMEFQQLLLEVGKALSTDNVKALAFLCTNILNRNTESVKSANDLFSRLVEQDHLSQERPYLLTELLRTIQRIDLVRKFHLNDGEPTSLISPYRKLLYNLSEELTTDDSSNVKFLLNDELPKRILDEKTSLLEVFLRMEQMNLLGDNNLNKLENIIHPVCPRLKVQITQFKAQQESSFTTLPLSTEASNSACSLSYLCSDTVDVSGSQENRTFSENQTSTNSFEKIFHDSSKERYLLDYQQLQFLSAQPQTS